MTMNLQRLLPAAVLAPALAMAAVDVRIEGPDQLVLVGPSNLGNTNITRAKVDTRDLGPGRLQGLLAPAIASAVEQCNANDIRAITLHAAHERDRVGETNTRFGGLGIYANLASNDRNSEGNWFVAPFFAFEGSVTTTAGTTERFELFDVNRIMLSATDRTTQEDFFRSRTQDVEASLAKFVATSVPKAAKAALSSHCRAR
jgi:hypothetical protein